MEVNTAKTLGFEAFASLSVPFFGVNHADAETCLAKLPDFLEHERVVAIGEIGLDCATQFEEDLFREHLRLAKANDLPVILHTPIRLAPQGQTVTPRVLEIIEEEGFPVERCVFDHAGEETLDFRMGTGAMVGLSICWDKMPPEAAARFVIDNPDGREQDPHQLRARRPGQRLLHGAARDARHAPDGSRQRPRSTRSAGRTRATSSGCRSTEPAGPLARRRRRPAAPARSKVRTARLRLRVPSPAWSRPDSRELFVASLCCDMICTYHYRADASACGRPRRRGEAARRNDSAAARHAGRDHVRSQGSCCHTTEGRMADILEGVRIIEMGHVVAVPAASSMMGDCGAAGHQGRAAHRRPVTHVPRDRRQSRVLPAQSQQEEHRRQPEAGGRQGHRVQARARVTTCS